MKIERFIYFVAIADAGSISAAARNCYISQSALSQQMEALEKELGVSLLIRRRDGIRLSEQGYQLLPKARQLIASYTDILETIKADQTKSHLRIGYSGPWNNNCCKRRSLCFTNGCHTSMFKSVPMPWRTSRMHCGLVVVISRWLYQEKLTLRSFTMSIS